MKLKINIKPKHVITVIICTVLNLLLGYAFGLTDTPFRFYMAGTVCAAGICGPVTAIVTAVISSSIMATMNLNNLSYIITGIGVAVAAGMVMPPKEKKDPFRVISAGVLSGFVAAVTATPLNLVFYNGSTNNKWGDGLITLLSNHINFKELSCFLGEAFIDIPEMVISAIVAAIAAICISKISEKKAAATAVTLCAVFLLTQAALPVKAADIESDYMGVRYDTDDGLVSAEINALAQTEDGYVWAGAYSGLYRYDGVHFVRTDIDDRISSVVQLFADSRGRLWIGTNESGLGCYDPEDDSIVFYDMSKGLAANAIRGITEDAAGNIYVGTIAELTVISPDGNISIIKEAAAENVRSLALGNDGLIVGVTNWGTLFFLKDMKVTYSGNMEDESGIYYAAVASAPDGSFILGTSSTSMMRFTISGNKPVFSETISTKDTGYYNAITYNDVLKGFFFCCENGLGFIEDKTDRITIMSSDDFGSSISDVMIDYQDNIWFASNKQGVMRYSWNPFRNVFAGTGIPADVVNALLMDDGQLYVGADNGLFVIDTKRNKQVKKKLSEAFTGVRVRHLSKDSKGNIWASTYGPDGLIKIGKDDSLTAYNETTKGTEGGRFRLAMECKNGEIAAATSSGLNFFYNDELTAKMGLADGLGAQILSMEELEGDMIIAGTDGDGVVFIKDHKIVDRIGEKEGLGSLVVLRVVPDGDGFFFICSNAIYYDNGSHKVRKLSNFPYGNNYDMFLPGDGTVWISSSAGIFIVNRDDLINDGDYSYTLLNRTRGFFTTLTANAKNAVDGDDLYLCCTDGVRKVSVSGYNSFDSKYEIRLSSLTVGDKEIDDEEDVYYIPPTSERLKFDVAVLNFTLSNPLIRIYLDGSGDSGVTTYQHELSPLSYTNIPYGEYTLRVQVLDESDGDILREESFLIEKEAQIFEKPVFMIYLGVVCVLLVIYFIWLLYTLRANAYRMRTLQKEATTDAMTGLLNKSASKRQIGEMCKNKRGILMMIDLDSFKLVNDLYGHDMGDKILIRFSELIKACIRSTDLAGRMGGDEFIAFIQNTDDVGSVESKTAFINEELVKSAKEYMGEDMNIPLGASIGAVLVPAEGTDFDELYRKADKALYTVKQNGKHGCAVYSKDAKKADTGENLSAKGLDEIAMILGERNIGKGAFKLDFEKMQTAYRLLMRLGSRYDLNVQMIEFVIEPGADKDGISEDVAEKFEEMAADSLRNSDIISDRGNGKYIVLLSEIETANAKVPIDRIMNKWFTEPVFAGYNLSYEDAKII